MRWNRKIVGWSVAVLAIVVYSLLPVAWITSLSFKQGDDINNQQFLPTRWSLDNYRTVFDTNLFTSALRNSLGISLIATAIAVALATVAAYAIARLEFKGKRGCCPPRWPSPCSPRSPWSGRCSTCGGRSGSTTRGSG